MHNIVHVQLMQSRVFAELKEQFERIEELIESGKTVTLDLIDSVCGISLKIDRDTVVKSELPPEELRSRSQNDNNSLTTMFTNHFSFDIDKTNHQVPSAEMAAQIAKASDQKPEGESEPKMSSSLEANLVPTGLPNPAIKYIGDDNWVIAEDCSYTTNGGFTITVKTGFKTDLASVPRILWAVVATFELSVAAPVFHDLIYRSAGEVALPDGQVAPADKTFNRQEADDLFLELMTLANIRAWKRKMAYYAVSSFAGYAWRKKDGETTSETKAANC